MARIGDGLHGPNNTCGGPLRVNVSMPSLPQVTSYINVHPRPLALYYFGDPPDEERHVLDKTTSGAVTINDCMSHVGSKRFRSAGSAIPAWAPITGTIAF